MLLRRSQWNLDFFCSLGYFFPFHSSKLSLLRFFFFLFHPDKAFNNTLKECRVPKEKASAKRIQMVKRGRQAEMHYLFLCTSVFYLRSPINIQTNWNQKKCKTKSGTPISQRVGREGLFRLKASKTKRWNSWRRTKKKKKKSRVRAPRASRQ